MDDVCAALARTENEGFKQHPIPQINCLILLALRPKWPPLSQERADVHQEVGLIATVAVSFVFAAILGYGADRLR
ncbi:hypothetical protein ACC771_04035, partial [Rhizobium ruizarguesonis]